MPLVDVIGILDSKNRCGKDRTRGVTHVKCGNDESGFLLLVDHNGCLLVRMERGRWKSDSGLLCTGIYLHFLHVRTFSRIATSGGGEVAWLKLC